MTSVFMIFEITQDYQILVPLMAANLLSFVISRRYQPVPVYHALLQQDGVHLPSAAVSTPKAVRTARHVMSTELSFIPAATSAADAWWWAMGQDTGAYLVGTHEHLYGTVTRQQLDEYPLSDRAREPMAALIDDSFVHAHPDHPIDVVLERLAESSGSYQS